MLLSMHVHSSADGPNADILTVVSHGALFGGVFLLLASPKNKPKNEPKIKKRAKKKGCANFPGGT
jgi:hypothetical protein